MKAPHWLLSTLTRLVPSWLATLRVVRVGRDRVESLQRSGQPILYAVWHRDAVLLLRDHQADRVTVLVSPSEDGSLLSDLLRRFEYEVVRGSTSRGAVAGWLGLRRAIKDGRTPVFAVDGPRGPAESVAPGVLVLARATGATIVPLAASSWRAGRLGTWDRTRIPWPGSRAVVVYGRPLSVQDEADLDAEAARLAQRLSSATRTAERLSG